MKDKKEQHLKDIIKREIDKLKFPFLVSDILEGGETIYISEDKTCVFIDLQNGESYSLEFKKLQKR